MAMFTIRRRKKELRCPIQHDYQQFIPYCVDDLSACDYFSLLVFSTQHVSSRAIELFSFEIFLHHLHMLFDLIVSWD